MKKNTINPVNDTPMGQTTVPPSAQAPKKKKSHFLPVFLICLVAVIGLGIGDVLLFRHFLETRKAKSLTQKGTLISTISTLSLGKDENDDFQILRSSFDEKITSKDDALRFIDHHSEEIGIGDTSSELSFLEKQQYNGFTYYKFRQIWHDVPVYGNTLTVAVDSDEKADCVTGTYTPVDISIDTAIDQSNAEEIAKKYAGDEPEILSSQLYIMPHSENDTTKLVYIISVTGSESAELIIDADSGEITNTYSLMSGVLKSVDVNLDGRIVNVDLEESSFADYDLKDDTRKISVSDGGVTTYTASILKYGLLKHHNPLSAVISKNNPDGSVDLFVGPGITLTNLLELLLPTDLPDLTIPGEAMLEKYSVISLSSMQNAYDYYNDKLGWQSVDGKGTPLRIVVGIQDQQVSLDAPTETIIDYINTLGWIIPTFQDVENSGFISGTTTIIIGAINGEPIAGKGIIGHEYTHGVINNIAHLERDIYSRTVNEGFADVMGSVISNDWEFTCHEIPEDYEYYYYLCRSAIDPNTFHVPAIKDESDEFYRPVPYDEHDGATIISHSAYLMNQYGLSYDQIADIFFRAMFMLSSKTNFDEAALSVMESARQSSLTGEELQAVTRAFIETKLFDPSDLIDIHVTSNNHPVRNASVYMDNVRVGKTDKQGRLLLDLDPRWIGKTSISIKAGGMVGVTYKGNIGTNKLYVVADLVREGHDAAINGEADENVVKVTVLPMTPNSDEDKALEKAQVFFVEKGTQLDLHDFIDDLSFLGITTDGTKLYFENENVPLELTYRIYGTDEIFDFTQPITEDVIIEPVVGAGDLFINFEDLGEFKETIDSIFKGDTIINKEYIEKVFREYVNEY